MTDRLHGPQGRQPERADEHVGPGEVDVEGDRLPAAQDARAVVPACRDVVHQSDHAWPVAREDRLVATDTSLAPRLEDRTQHPVDGRVDGPADGHAVQLRTLERQSGPVWQRPISRQHVIPLRRAHRALQRGEHGGKRLLIVPDVGAVQGARTTDIAIPVHGRGAQATLESEGAALRVHEDGRAANQRGLGGERFSDALVERGTGPRVGPVRAMPRPACPL